MRPEIAVALKAEPTACCATGSRDTEFYNNADKETVFNVDRHVMVDTNPLNKFGIDADIDLAYWISACLVAS